MTRVLALHQPNFLPWVGFFHKVLSADVFVLLDTAQVPRGRSYAYRTRIKGPDGARWLSMPLPRGDFRYSTQPLKKMDEWWGDVMGNVRSCYARAPHYGFNDFEMEMLDAVHRACTLAEFNACLIGWALDALDVDTQMELKSEVNSGQCQTRQALPAVLTQKLGCDTYLSGAGARAYNDPQEFAKRGFSLRYQEFQCPEYPQRWGKFEKNLSIIDLLFNCGLEAKDVLLGQTSQAQQ